MAQWFGSRESRALAASGLPVRVLDARALRLRATLGRMNAFRGLGARTRALAVVRRCAGLRRRSARIRAPDARALLIAKPRVRSPFALMMGRRVPSADRAVVRHDPSGAVRPCFL